MSFRASETTLHGSDYEEELGIGDVSDDFEWIHKSVEETEVAVVLAYRSGSERSRTEPVRLAVFEPVHDSRVRRDSPEGDR